MKVFVGYAVYSEVTKKFIRMDTDCGYQYKSFHPEIFSQQDATKNADPKNLTHLGSNFDTYKVVSIFAESI